MAGVRIVSLNPGYKADPMDPCWTIPESMRRGVEDLGPAVVEAKVEHRRKAQPKKVARRDRRELLALGWSAVEINKMNPGYAQELAHRRTSAGP